MGVRILYDERAGQAALYCSTSDWAFGPVFYGHSDKTADERLEAFLRWLRGYQPKNPSDFAPMFGGWRHDPRELNETGLDRAYTEWLSQEEAQYQREAEAA